MMQHKDLEKSVSAISEAERNLCRIALSDWHESLSRRAQAMLAAAGMDAPATKWYIVSVMDVSDHELTRSLTLGRIECWSPQVEVKPTRRGGMKPQARQTVHKRVTPGHVFVRIAPTADAWAALSTVKGVGDLLGMGGKPSVVRDVDVTLFKAYCAGDPNAVKIITNALQPLDTALVKEGPFRSFSGVVQSVDDDRGMAILEIFVFGRLTRAEATLAQLSKL
jgi:transcriptional antiterminator NusG